MPSLFFFGTLWYIGMDGVSFEKSYGLEVCMKRYWVLMVLVFMGCGGTSASLKVATYNVYWLDADISEARKTRLQQIIADLDADIIGFQEIQSRAALENILPDHYEIGMVDDDEALQELAIAVRKPWALTSFKMVFPEEVHDKAFPRKRDLIEAQIEGPGRLLKVFVHHAKSRSGGRLATNEQRVAASTMMMQYLKSRVEPDQIIVLGDFNDNPDDRSLNILEYGQVDAEAGVDQMPDTFLFNATESLVEKNHCSYGYHYLYENLDAKAFDPVVAGSRDENNKWREKEHDFMRDVKVKAILFDQILISQNLKDHLQDVGIFTGASAVVGTRSRIRFEEDQLVYTTRGSFASDHVPVWAVFRF